MRVGLPTLSYWRHAIWRSAGRLRLVVAVDGGAHFMAGVVDMVSRMARPVVEGFGLSLWDVEFVREHGESILRVVIDHPDGVSLDQCEKVSRVLDPLLDSADPLPGPYLFQVSSAGLERELKRPSDFEMFIGKPVTVKLYSPRGGKREFVGKLAAYEGGFVSIEGEGPFDMKQVAQVRLKYEFFK